MPLQVSPVWEPYDLANSHMQHNTQHNRTLRCFVEQDDKKLDTSRARRTENLLLCKPFGSKYRKYTCFGAQGIRNQANFWLFGVPGKRPLVAMESTEIDSDADAEERASAAADPSLGCWIWL